MSKEVHAADTTLGHLPTAGREAGGRRLGERFWVPGAGYVVHTKAGQWIRGELVEVSAAGGVHLHLADSSDCHLDADVIRFVYQADERMPVQGHREVDFEALLHDGQRLNGALPQLSSAREGLFLVGSIGDLQGRFLLAPEIIESLQLSMPDTVTEAEPEPVPVAKIEAHSQARFIQTQPELKQYLDVLSEPLAHRGETVRKIDVEAWFAQAGEDEESRLRFSQAERFDVPLIDLAGIEVSEEAAATISPALARRLHVLPLA